MNAKPLIAYICCLEKKDVKPCILINLNSNILVILLLSLFASIHIIWVSYRSDLLLQFKPTEPALTAANMAADLTYESSCQSHTIFSSNPAEGRPGSSQTQTSTGATSCTVDDTDTDSSVPSSSEQNFSNGVDSAAYKKLDTYSIVGSLNPTRMETCLNRTGQSGLFSAGVQLLNVGRFQREDTTPQCLTLPEGALGNNKGWTAGVKPGITAASNTQPLRMEELLNIRLDQVTSDQTQPPYDSLQTYEFEGRDSRAESLSSLESDGEKDDRRLSRETGGGMEELNQKFQQLVEIIRDRQKEKETRAAGESLAEPHKQRDNKENQEHKWDF